MNINVSADVGQNLTGLVQKLAEQIGVTADKVFPWYIKQSGIEGRGFFVSCGLALAVALLLLVPGLILTIRGDPSSATRHYNYIHTPVVIGVLASILGAIFLLIGVIAAILESPAAYAKIKNPEYYATRAFLQDVGNLIPGGVNKKESNYEHQFSNRPGQVQSVLQPYRYHYRGKSNLRTLRGRN